MNNINISELITNTEEYVKKLNNKQLTDIIIELKNSYYSGDELVPDYVFDILEDILRDRDPNNIILKKIDKIDEDYQQENLDYFMHSQNKAKEGTGDIDKWLNKYNGPYVVSHKIDGISLLLIYKKTTSNFDINIFTRGTGGMKGKNVTRHLYSMDILNDDILNKLKNLPYNKIAIRGELIISKKVWDKYYNNLYPMVRNFVSGLINQKISNINDLKRVNFVTYQIFEPLLKPDEQFKLLEYIGFNVAPYKIFSMLDEKIIKEYLYNAIKNGEYQIDGVVIIQNKLYNTSLENPKHSIAYKIKGDIQNTKVINVEWNVSKHGLLKPVAIIEPIYISGAKITRATLHNALFVKDNKIGPGSIISIIRSGEIIPYVYKVLKNSDNGQGDFPINVDFIWHNNDIKMIGNNSDINIARLVHMADKLNIDNMGPGVIKTLTENGYDTIDLVLNINKGELINLIGKNGEKIYESIRKMKKTGVEQPGSDGTGNGVKLSVLMDASNCFESGIGTKIMDVVLNNIPNILEYDTNNINNKKLLYDKLIDIKGIQEITANKILNGLIPFKKLIEKINDIKYYINIQKNNGKNKGDNGKNKGDNGKNNLIFNKNFIFSGFRSNDLEKIIEDNGGYVLNNISKKKENQILLVKNIEEESSKIKAAKELKIPIIEIDIDKIKEYDYLDDLLN